jgi:hypothetical protein
MRMLPQKALYTMSSAPSSADAPAPVAPAKKDSPLQNLLYAVICLAAGLGLLIWQYMDTKATQATLKWPTTDGEITASSLEEKQVYRKKRLRDVYDPKIEYAYQVDGAKLTGTRIDMDNSYSTEDPTKGKENLALFPVGKKVTVSYDPNDHSSSVIEAGMSASNKRMYWFILIFGAIITFLGVVGVPSSIYEVIKKKPAEA